MKKPEYNRIRFLSICIIPKRTDRDYLEDLIEERYVNRSRYRDEISLILERDIDRYSELRRWSVSQFARHECRKISRLIHDDLDVCLYTLGISGFINLVARNIVYEQISQTTFL